MCVGAENGFVFRHDYRGLARSAENGFAMIPLDRTKDGGCAEVPLALFVVACAES
jgi:hypothetical protein